MDDDLQEKIQAIEELCHLLKQEDVGVTDWYKNVSETLRDVDMFTALEFADERERKSVNTPVLPQLFHILRECLLNHRWSEALEVMKTIVNVPTETSQTIWKVGTELLCVDAETNRDMMQQLFSQMRQVTDLNGKEVVMEFTTYLLGIGDDADAITLMQAVMKRQGRKTDKSEKEKYVDKLHKAYLGLLWYLGWKKCKKECEELQTEQSSMAESESLSQNPIQLKMQSLAMQERSFRDRAVACFKELVGYAGIWDIVVTKQVELLVSNDQQGDALAVLKKYCDTNPDSLNAHKYLYRFLKEHQLNQEDQIQTLKVIAKLSPSDGAVLDLCSRLIKDGKLGNSVQYLFDLLDYSCWQLEWKPWHMLAKCLKKLKHGSGEREVVKSCWSVREAWWPRYHFTKQAASSSQHNQSLLFQKTVVATLLCGKDSYFVTEAMQYLSKKEIALLP